MARRIHAPTLIELAIDTLKSDVRDGGGSLTPGQRYAIAMAVNALATARAEILSDPEAAVWQLLDDIYDDDGVSTLATLARDIRSKTINEQTHPDLRANLEKLLVAELETRNPAALKRRAAARAG